MTQELNQPIRRIANGSIDTRYYMMRGRRERSRQAYAMAASVRRFLRATLPTT